MNKLTVLVDTYLRPSRLGWVLALLWISSLSTLSIAQPTLSKQPQDNVRCAGLNTFFEIGATGNALTYQWQEKRTGDNMDFANMDGRTSSILAFPPTLAMNGYKYRVIVRDGTGPQVTSREALLTVRAKPEILQQPANESTCVGDSAVFEVIPRGTDEYTYRWLRESPIPGSSSESTGGTESKYKIISATSSINGYKYWVEVSNGICPETSRKATLTVNDRPGSLRIANPGAVCFPNTVDITERNLVNGSPPGLTYSYYTDRKARSELANPDAVSVSGTYYLQGKNSEISGGCKTTPAPMEVVINRTPSVANTGPYRVCNGGSTSIILTTTTQIASPAFSWTVVDPDRAGASAQPNPGAGKIVQTLNNGTQANRNVTYRVTPHAAPCQSGAATDISVVVTRDNAPNMVANPASLSVCSGARFSVALSSTNNVAGTQFRWVSIFPETVTGASNQQALTNDPLTGTLSTDEIENISGEYLISAVAGGCNGSVFALPVTVKPIPSIAFDSPGSSVCSGQRQTVTPRDTTGLLNTEYIWTVSAPATVTNAVTPPTVLSPVDNIVIQLSSTAKITQEATYTVTPINASCRGQGRSYVVQVDVGPSINQQPVASQNICMKEEFVVSVQAVGSGNLSYQWDIGSTSINGATGSSYTIQAVGQGNAGEYKVKIENDCNSVTSNKSVLTVTQDAYFENATVAVTPLSINYGERVQYTYTGPDATYEWVFGDGSANSNLKSPGNHFYKSGTYESTLTATRSESCFKRYTLPTVTVTGPDEPIPTAFHPPESGAVKIYPIPVRDRLYISSNHLIHHISLIDMYGREQISHTSASKDVVLHTGQLVNGWYLIRVQNKSGVEHIEKIVKK